MIVGAIVVAFYLVGCGEGVEGPEEGPPGAFSFMKSRARLRAAVHCRARYEKCPGKPPVENRVLTARQCLRGTVRKWSRLGDESAKKFGLEPAVFRAIDAGAIEYDAEAAGTCLDAFRSYVDQLGCIQARRLESLVMRGVIERDLISSCSEVFTPKTEEGEACGTDLECVDDLECRRTSEDSGDCGKCRPPTGADGSRRSGFTYAREGESCGSPSHTPTCDPTAPVLCESGEAGGWRCQPETSRAEGESCRSSGICEDGLMCRGGTCQPFEIVDQGEACEDAEVFCEQRLICRSNEEGERVCAGRGWHGDSCLSDAECVGDFWCGPVGRDRGAVGHCMQLGGEGDACEQGRCGDGLYCPPSFEPDGGECQPKHERGEECDRRNECVAGLECAWTESAREQTCREPDGESRELSTDACRRDGGS